MNSIKDAALFTVDTLMYLPLIIFCFLPVTHKIKQPIGKLVIKVLLAVIAMEGIILLVYITLPIESAHIFNSILCVLIFFWLYQREVNLDVFRLWFIFMTACLIGGFGFLVYHVVDIFLYPYGGLDKSSVPTSLLLQIFFESALILIIYYPAKKHLKWLVSNFHKDRVWKIIWIFPMLFTIVFNYFIPYDKGKMYIGRALNLYLAAIIIFLVMIIALYVMFYLIAYSITENERIMEHTTYLKMEAEQYRMLQNHVQDMNRFRHDLRHQLTALSQMLEHQEYQEAQRFLKSYQLNIPKSAKQYCSSSAINAILNHYNSICQEEDITARFSIRLPNEIKIEDTDFCVLLGNLLENALYGCRSIKEGQRDLVVKIGQTTPGAIALIIRNPYSGTILQRGDTFLSSRHNGEGQGLKSVSIIVAKYNGFMKAEYNDHQFLVKVLLNT